MAADYVITIYLDDDRQRKLAEADLGGSIRDIQGKKAIQVNCSKKDQKKLVKAFPELVFDSDNATVLPKEAEEALFNMILETKTLDVMKVYIMKAYNPLAGKEIRSKVH